MTKLSPVQKFLLKCDNTPADPSTGCKIYRGRNDYPKVAEFGKGNRLILTRTLGRPIRPGFFACHTCDNKGCVTPEHLYEGTPKQNIQDAWERGLSKPRVWTEEDKEKKRQWFRDNQDKIPRGDDHWLRKNPEKSRKGVEHHKAKLTDDDVEGIRRFYSMGILNQYELAEKYNVSQNVVSRTVNRKLWNHVT